MLRFALRAATWALRRTGEKAGIVARGYQPVCGTGLVARRVPAAHHPPGVACLTGFEEDVSLSFISLRRMEGLIVLHDKGFLIMVSIR